MQNSRPNFPPTVALGFAILAASSSSLFIRFAQQDAASITIAALRLIFATLLLSPILLIKYRAGFKNYSRRTATLSMAAGLLLAIHFATWISSLEFTSVASSVVLVQTSPLFVALLSSISLKEGVNRAVALGLGIAFVGSLIVGLSDICAGFSCPSLAELVEGEAIKGDILALLGGVAGAGYIVIGRSLRGKVPLMPYLGVVYGSSALVLLVIMLLAGQSPFGLPPRAYLWIVLLAIFPQLIAHSTYNWALRFLPATVVAVTLMGEPIGAAILAGVLLEEIPPFVRLLGGALMLAGIVLVSIMGQDRPNRIN
jgi:drug/metabolite transporter (DMT)-like permease